MGLSFVQLVVLLVVTPTSLTAFLLIVYWLLKANKIIGGKLKKFVIWMFIAMFGCSLDQLIIYIYNELGIITGEIWIIIESVVSLTTIIAFIISGYQLKNLFK